MVSRVLASPGQPLDQAARVEMESRFGHDFSRVRVHTDARAAESVRAVDALAYTVGRDVVFAAGQYMPETGPGRGLLAHELAHVVQQEQPSPRVEDAVVKAPSGGRHEQAAEAAAKGIAAGQRVSVSTGSVGIGLQRQSALGKVTPQEIEKCVRKWEKHPEEFSRLAAGHFVANEMPGSDLDLTWAPVECETDTFCKVMAEENGPVFDVTISKSSRRIGVGLSRAGRRRFCAYDYDDCERFNRRTPGGEPKLTLVDCHGSLP